MPLQARQAIQQRLMLAPTVTLALEVLRMPTMELQAFLQSQLEQNPLLELDAEDDDPSAGEEASPSDGQEHPASLDEEWMDHWRTASEWESREDEEEAEDLRAEHRLAGVPSLLDSLRLQLGCLRVSAEERRLGDLLIQRLDEHGYLDADLGQLAAESGTDPQQLEQVLKLLQRFDPPGIAARDLRECLLIQLELRGVRPDLLDPDQSPIDLAYLIVRDHTELLLERRLGALARATRSPRERLEQACALIKGLNPRPGRGFSTEVVPAVIPDLIIRRRERHFDVELNDSEIPRLRVNRAYSRMLRDPRTPADAREFLLQRFRQAGWLIRAIDERNTTVLSVARCLLSLQRRFVEHGPQALQPLTQAQVARLIGRHPSTVSRAIAGKTIDTPYGIFPLDQLFASGVPQPSNADGVSDAKIKAQITRLIEQEEPHHPLSDEALAARIAEEGIAVARRTIAKYRASLKILPAHLRRRRL